MTVKELRTQLAAFPDDMEVRIFEDDKSAWKKPDGPRILEKELYQYQNRDLHLYIDLDVVCGRRSDYSVKNLKFVALI